MTDLTFELIANLLLSCALVVSTAFVVMFGLFSNWRSSLIGRNQFFLMSFLAFYFGFALMSNLYPDFPGRQIHRVIIYGGVTVFLAIQLVTLLRIQWSANKGLPTKKPETYEDTLTHSTNKKEKK